MFFGFKLWPLNTRCTATAGSLNRFVALPHCGWACAGCSHGHKYYKLAVYKLKSAILYSSTRVPGYSSYHWHQQAAILIEYSSTLYLEWWHCKLMNIDSKPISIFPIDLLWFRKLCGYSACVSRPAYFPRMFIVFCKYYIFNQRTHDPPKSGWYRGRTELRSVVKNCVIQL